MQSERLRWWYRSRGAWAPSERAKAAGAPVEVDISKLQEGQQLTVEWRGKPIWIVKRSPEMMNVLPSLDGKLADPNSNKDQQPEYAKNAVRSVDESPVIVLIGICTHLGCSPTFRPDFGTG